MSGSQDAEDQVKQALCTKAGSGGALIHTGAGFERSRQKGCEGCTHDGPNLVGVGWGGMLGKRVLRCRLGRILEASEG